MRHPFRSRLPAVLAATLSVVAVGGLAGAALMVDTPPAQVLTAELRATPPADDTAEPAAPEGLPRSVPRTPVTTPPVPPPLALAEAVEAATAAHAKADQAAPCPSTRAAAPRLPGSGSGSGQGCPDSPDPGPQVHH